jgi:TIR domain
MRIFISWSGKTSRIVADSLAKWLKMLPFSSIDTWVSGESINPGTRWSKELSMALENTNLGILCLTRVNQLQPWICYEAGALSKVFDKSLVIPYLIDFTAQDLLHPIKQFQAISANKDETWKIGNRSPGYF